MTSYTPFKEVFKDVALDVEDVYLLESFQINMLPGIADRDLDVVLWAYPSIRSFFVKKGKISVLFHAPQPVSGYDRQNLPQLIEKVRNTIQARLEE